MDTSDAADTIAELSELGIQVPEILLPEPGIDLKTFAVVACDQFTSEPEYWDEVDSYVGDAPSALRCVLPEVYLESSDVDDRIRRAQETAARYCSEGILRSLGEGMILTKRSLQDGSIREGLVLALDLEAYDFSSGSESLIRATEKTILERLPPRVRIRMGAAIELPHIMVMIDDSENRVFSYLSSIREDLPSVYDTELMLGGGSVSGRLLSHSDHIRALAAQLRKLVDPKRLREKYDTDTPLLFPVGDGNHSLAAARTYWLGLKEQGAPMDHPARYALVEVVNLHGSGMSFHPIHRLIRRVSVADLYEFLKEHGFRQTDRNASDSETVRVHSAHDTSVFVPPEGSSLTVGLVDSALSRLAESRSTLSVDYVHDLDSLSRWMAEGAVLLEMPAINPHDIVPTVIRDGALPRKAFSIGEARDKRYYLEARRIRNDNTLNFRAMGVE